ncbi:MAG: hypothetical protein OXC92_04225 [Flavobacteriaceae bacterium]|nr:hypothetical protein [Flavobacteriaceae bacterium]
MILRYSPLDAERAQKQREKALEKAYQRIATNTFQVRGKGSRFIQIKNQEAKDARFDGLHGVWTS